MMDPARLAVAGVGNNISALLQGIYFYRGTTRRIGITNPQIGGLSVEEVEFTAAFDIDSRKVGLDLGEAVLQPPNNYPQLISDIPRQNVTVEQGFVTWQDVATEHKRIVESLKRSKAEVLLYSLPTGLQWAATAYAEAAIDAGLAFVNCTPELVARNAALADRFRAADLPLLGDDLAGHLGASVVHRALLRLFNGRGIDLDGSYQINVGGNEDFRNLHANGSSKHASKLNAIADSEFVAQGSLTIVPSAGYVPHLSDEKIAFISIDGLGWAGTHVSLEVKLRVQDSSNAAGVIIDLLRIAAVSRRRTMSGFIPAAAPLLKSPPGGMAAYPAESVMESMRNLEGA